MDVIDLLLADVGAKLGRLCICVFIDDVFKDGFDIVRLVLCIVAVFDSTTAEFGTLLIVVGMIKVVLGVVILFELLRVDIRLNMLDTFVVVVAIEKVFSNVVAV